MAGVLSELLLKVWYNVLNSTGGGGVAQGLEQAAHNRLVVGSSPTAPTSAIFCS